MHQYDSQSIAALIAAQQPGYSLDQRFYTDPAIYELELEKIISRNWFLAGHTSELAEPGDFKVLNIARESAIIVRGADGAIKAFANVCRHRGSLVCLEQKGNTRKFTCPYHGWSYDLEGKLIGVPFGKEGFDSINRDELGLRELNVQEKHGMIFVMPNPELDFDIDEVLGGIQERLSGFGGENQN